MTSEGAKILASVCGRATCWSITINNPTEEDKSPNLPAGWKFTGQLERGEEGTEHIQAMLTTPQVRFSAVKRHFPRAHIEAARDRNALQAYVHKPESRVGTLETSYGMTAFQLTEQIISGWNDDEYQNWVGLRFEDPHMRYADCLIKRLIEGGASGGIEYVAINPMWRSAFKRYGLSMIARQRMLVNSIDAQTPAQEACSSPCEEIASRSVPSPPESDGECNGIL